MKKLLQTIGVIPATETAPTTQATKPRKRRTKRGSGWGFTFNAVAFFAAHGVETIAKPAELEQLRDLQTRYSELSQRIAEFVPGKGKQFIHEGRDKFLEKPSGAAFDRLLQVNPKTKEQAEAELASMRYRLKEGMAKLSEEAKPIARTIRERAADILERQAEAFIAADKETCAKFHLGGDGIHPAAAAIEDLAEILRGEIIGNGPPAGWVGQLLKL